MDTLNQDIIIRVRSEYQDLQNLQNKLEQLKSQFKSISKGRVDFGLKKMIKTSADPIREATKQLEIAQKNLERTQTKLRTAMVTGADPTTIGALRNNESMAESRLMSVIKTVEHTKEIAIEEERITAEYQKQQAYFEKLSHAQEALNKLMLSLDPVKQKMSNLQNKMAGLQQEFINFNMEGKNTKGTENAIKKVYKQIQKLEESTKKSAGWISKLMGRIRNISIYRMIRSGIKWLTSGVSEGLQGLAIYNNEVNKSMSNINNSLGQIKNTLAISFASVLQALEPTITALSDALVDLINSFNLAMAKIQGKDFYTKAKKSADAYAKSAQKAQKLSFDTFEVLSGGDDKTPTQDLLEDGSVAEDANEMSNAFEHIFRIIQDVLGVIKQIIQDLKESGILGILLDIVGIIAQIAGDLTHLLTPVIKSVLEQVQGALQIISGFLKLLTGDFEGAWNLIGNGFASMCNGIINLFVQLAGGIVKLLNLLFVKLNPFFWILKAFGIDVGQKIDNWTEGWSNWRLNWKPIKGYYNGGVPAQGDLFYMNEHGPEAFVNTGGAQTNVINIDQLSEGMRRGFVQAIYDTGMLTAMQQGSSTIVVDKDVLGRTVAESAGFRNEVNRRNVSLNLR